MNAIKYLINKNKLLKKNIPAMPTYPKLKKLSFFFSKDNKKHPYPKIEIKIEIIRKKY